MRAIPLCLAIASLSWLPMVSAENRTIAVRVTTEEDSPVRVSVYSSIESETRSNVSVEEGAAVLRAAQSSEVTVTVGIVAPNVELRDYLPLLTAISEAEHRLAFIESGSSDNVRDIKRLIERSQVEAANPEQPKVVISEFPSDGRLQSALGLQMRCVEVLFPSSMKLSVITRVYRDGVLDSTMSSRQEHGMTGHVGNAHLTLGCLDPDEMSPKPHGKVKVFGEGGTMWIDMPTDESFGWSIAVPKTGEIEAKDPQLAMELVCGTGNPSSSLGLSEDDLREGSGVRVTVHVLVEPLNAEEQLLLKKQSNFTKAVKVEE